MHNEEILLKYINHSFTHFNWYTHTHYSIYGLTLGNVSNQERKLLLSAVGGQDGGVLGDAEKTLNFWPLIA